MEIQFPSQKYLITTLALIKVHLIFTCSIFFRSGLTEYRCRGVFITIKSFKIVWRVKLKVNGQFETVSIIHEPFVKTTITIIVHGFGTSKEISNGSSQLLLKYYFLDQSLTLTIQSLENWKFWLKLWKNIFKTCTLQMCVPG